MRKIRIYLLLAFIFSANPGFAQTYNFDESSFVYKTVDGIELEMVMYKPQINTSIKLPALVFYFGGGWVSGTPEHFRLQAEYFATRGIVVFCPDYRTKSRHNTTPFESVKDAKSAIRYLKTHASDLGIDTSRIVASGGSAGGHLAAGTAILDKINEDSDNTSISTVPFALVLFNPVVDTGKRGYGQEKLVGREFEISPVHHIDEGVPPTLIMHGKADTTVPYENVLRFKYLMQQEGNKCVLVGYKHQKHGFFNYGKKSKYFRKTLKRTEVFLEDFNLLRGESWVRKYCKNLGKK